ncbi:hypothetical protein GOB86_04785 [Acetobacter lambici]|uniref:Uncharacterized protein n=1 Tax=Acetobacter lambici TaxID=1332824 RepID=A0ABT1EX00_9PROT|nr:hypothetical protein [Acetobacter lambici]MCP1241910.1 hypothetical protein [Acetobacter lambici]MCP1257471.1 hypothetical protein [Acetobacter lambici]NHO56389.1 hypothetical protein [Acetobacter lambici]
MAQVDGSIRLTLLKTGATVGLTALLVFVLRWVLGFLPQLDAITGGHAGGDVLRFLASNGHAQAQQGVAIALIVFCFALAVLVVHAAERILRRRRSRR